MNTEFAKPDMDPQEKLLIQNALLQLAQAYWRMVDRKFPDTQLTPPVRFSTMVSSMDGNPDHNLGVTISIEKFTGDI